MNRKTLAAQTQQTKKAIHNQTLQSTYTALQDQLTLITNVTNTTQKATGHNLNPQLQLEYNMHAHRAYQTLPTIEQQISQTAEQLDELLEAKHQHRTQQIQHTNPNINRQHTKYINSTNSTTDRNYPPNL